MGKLNAQLVLRVADVTASTECCLCRSFCAGDIWSLTGHLKHLSLTAPLQDSPHSFRWHQAQAMPWWTEVSGLMLLSCHPHTSLFEPLRLRVITGTQITEWNICCRLHGCLLFFLFRLPKMSGRWWSRCMTGIAWSNRSSPEPTPSLLLWVEHSLWGISLVSSWGSRNHHTFVYNTITKSQPPLALKDQANGWSMTHFTLKLGKAGQGTLVPTCEPQGTSHLVLFLLFPLGCCCYFIHPLFGTASLLFPYQPMLSCRSSMLLGSTGLYVQASCTQNTDLSRSHRWRQACPWMKERALSLLTLNLY